MSYLQRSGRGGEQTEMEGGQKEKENGHFIYLRRSDNSHGPSIHRALDTFHSDCSVRLGQWGKNPALQAEAIWSFAGFGRFSV